LNSMLILFGLGNPGEKYIKTRHNIGFRLLEVFARENNFPDFSVSKRFSAETSEGLIGKNKVILIKPLTFMNNSGKSVSEITSYYKKGQGELIVIHDDIDLPFNKIRIVRNRGAAGHKGVESVIKGLETKDFIRIRVGINSGGTDFKHKQAEDFVLKNFNKKEEKSLKEISEKVIDAITILMDEGLEKSMSLYNR